jgi:hypothetical protein
MKEQQKECMKGRLKDKGKLKISKHITKNQVKQNKMEFSAFTLAALYFRA